MFPVIACMALALFAISLLAPASVRAQSVNMGNCANDDSIPPERIIVACKNFISDRMVENWRTEYIPDAIYFRGIAYQRLGRDKEAQADFLRLMHEAPGFANAWVRYGQIAEKFSPGQMMKVLDMMIAANQTDPVVLNTACWERAKRGEQLDAALADCNESLRLRPNNADALDSRALVNFQLGKYQSAVNDDTAALGQDSKLASALYIRGLAKRKMGDAAGSSSDIAAAKAIDPQVADTYSGYNIRQ